MDIGRLWIRLGHAEMASCIATGLEYALRGQHKEARPLLEDIKELSKTITRAAKVFKQPGIQVQDIEIWQLADDLTKAGGNLDSLASRVRKTQRKINYYFKDPNSVSKEKLEECQHFMNDIAELLHMGRRRYDPREALEFLRREAREQADYRLEASHLYFDV